MSVLTVAAVGMLGGAGAVARLLLDGGVSDRWSGSLPLGTLAVNLLGTVVLGVLVGAGTGDDALRLWATGLLGSFTTFSTWMLESQRLAEGGDGRAAAANIVVSLLLGVGLAWAGMELGGVL